MGKVCKKLKKLISITLVFILLINSNVDLFAQLSLEKAKPSAVMQGDLRAIMASGLKEQIEKSVSGQVNSLCNSLTMCKMLSWEEIDEEFNPSINLLYMDDKIAEDFLKMLFGDKAEIGKEMIALAREDERESLRQIKERVKSIWKNQRKELSGKTLVKYFSYLVPAVYLADKSDEEFKDYYNTAYEEYLRSVDESFKVDLGNKGFKIKNIKDDARQKELLGLGEIITGYSIVKGGVEENDLITNLAVKSAVSELSTIVVPSYITILSEAGQFDLLEKYIDRLGYDEVRSTDTYSKTWVGEFFTLMMPSTHVKRGWNNSSSYAPGAVSRNGYYWDSNEKLHNMWEELPAVIASYGKKGEQLLNNIFYKDLVLAYRGKLQPHAEWNKAIIPFMIGSIGTNKITARTYSGIEKGGSEYSIARYYGANIVGMVELGLLSYKFYDVPSYEYYKHVRNIIATPYWKEIQGKENNLKEIQGEENKTRHNFEVRSHLSSQKGEFIGGVYNPENKTGLILHSSKSAWEGGRNTLAGELKAAGLADTVLTTYFTYELALTAAGLVQMVSNGVKLLKAAKSLRALGENGSLLKIARGIRKGHYDYLIKQPKATKTVAQTNQVQASKLGVQAEAKPQKIPGLFDNNPVKVDVTTGKVTPVETAAEMPAPQIQPLDPKTIEIIGQDRVGVYNVATGEVTGTQQPQTLVAQVGEGSGGSGSSALNKVRNQKNHPNSRQRRRNAVDKQRRIEEWELQRQFRSEEEKQARISAFENKSWFGRKWSILSGKKIPYGAKASRFELGLEKFAKGLSYARYTITFVSPTIASGVSVAHTPLPIKAPTEIVYTMPAKAPVVNTVKMPNIAPKTVAPKLTNVNIGNVGKTIPNYNFLNGLNLSTLPKTSTFAGVLGGVRFPTLLDTPFVAVRKAGDARGGALEDDGKVPSATITSNSGTEQNAVAGVAAAKPGVEQVKSAPIPENVETKKTQNGNNNKSGTIFDKVFGTQNTVRLAEIQRQKELLPWQAAAAAVIAGISLGLGCVADVASAIGTTLAMAGFGVAVGDITTEKSDKKEKPATGMSHDDFVRFHDETKYPWKYEKKRELAQLSYDEISELKDLIKEAEKYGLKHEIAVEWAYGEDPKEGKRRLQDHIAFVKIGKKLIKENRLKARDLTKFVRGRYEDPFNEESEKLSILFITEDPFITGDVKNFKNSKNIKISVVDNYAKAQKLMNQNPGKYNFVFSDNFFDIPSTEKMQEFVKEQGNIPFVLYSGESIPDKDVLAPFDGFISSQDNNLNEALNYASNFDVKKETDIPGFVAENYIPLYYDKPFDRNIKGGMRILIANDAESVSKDMTKFLMNSPLAKYVEIIDFAANSEEAIEKLVKNPDGYDIVFADYLMGTDSVGQDIARYVYLSELDIPVIFMSDIGYKPEDMFVRDHFAGSLNIRLNDPESILSYASNFLTSQKSDILGFVKENYISVNYKGSFNENTPKMRILLINDRERLALDIRRLLNTEPYSQYVEIFDLASDADQAITMLRENPGKYNIVFTDYLIDQNVGTDIAKYIHDSNLNIPVILVTANTYTGKKVFKDMYCDGYLNAGFNNGKQILNYASNFLAGRQQAQSNSKQIFKVENYIDGSYKKPFNTSAPQMNILWVNDDNNEPKDIKKFLKQYSYAKYINNIDVVSNSYDALGKLQENPGKYNIVFSDYILSGESTGKEVADYVYVNNLNIPVILLSGKGYNPKRSFNQHFDGYLNPEDNYYDQVFSYASNFLVAQGKTKQAEQSKSEISNKDDKGEEKRSFGQIFKNIILPVLPLVAAGVSAALGNIEGTSAALSLAGFSYYLYGTNSSELPNIRVSKEVEDFIRLRKEFNRELFSDFELDEEEAKNMERILGKDFFNLWQKYFNKDLVTMARTNPEDIAELAKYSNRYENTLPSQFNNIFAGTNPLYVFAMRDMTNNFIKAINDGKTIEQAITALGEEMFEYHKKIYQIKEFLDQREDGFDINWDEVENPEVLNHDFNKELYFDLAVDYGFGKLNTSKENENGFIVGYQYNEYLDELKNFYNHPKTYGDVTLTESVRKGNIFEIIAPNHIRKNGIPNNTFAFNAMQGDLDVIKPIITKYQQTGNLSEKDLNTLHNNIADISYIFTNAMPFFRGTSAANLAVVYGLYQMVGIDAPQVKIGRALDLSAFVTSPEQYKKDWTNLFNGELPKPKQLSFGARVRNTFSRENLKNLVVPIASITAVGVSSALGNPAAGFTLASFPFFVSNFGNNCLGDGVILPEITNPELRKFVDLRKNFDIGLFREEPLTREEEDMMREILGVDFFNIWQTYYGKDLKRMAIEEPEKVAKVMELSNMFESTLPSKINSRWSGTNPLYLFTMEKIMEDFENDLYVKHKSMKEAVTNLGQKMFEYHKKINQIRKFVELKREVRLGRERKVWRYEIENLKAYNKNSEIALKEGFGPAYKIGFGKIPTVYSPSKTRIGASDIEYWDKIINPNYTRFNSYNGVELSVIKTEGFYPNIVSAGVIHANSVENIDRLFEVLQEKWDYTIRGIVDKAKSGEPLTQKDIKDLHGSISEISFLFTNVTPFYRGSASGNLLLVHGLYDLAGIKVPPIKMGIELDWEAFATTPFDYMDNWLNLFDGDFTYKATSQPIIKTSSEDKNTDIGTVAAKEVFTWDYKDKIFPRVEKMKYQMRELLPESFKDFLRPPFGKSQNYFRGMVLDYEGLEYLLKNGLLLKDGLINFANNSSEAIPFAQRFEFGNTIPVMVKVNPVKQIEKDLLSFFSNDYISRYLISAKDIVEVIAYVEIDGKIGWRKVSLNENGEVVLQASEDMKTTKEAETVDESEQVIAAETNPVAEKIFPAEILFTDEYKKIAKQVNISQDMLDNLPPGFEEKNHVLYRGMTIKDNEALSGISNRGLLVSKTDGYDIVFATPSIESAIKYALQTEKYGHIPVLIKTHKIVIDHIDAFGTPIYGYKNLAYKDIDAVLVWAKLEKDGKAAWWKAELDDKGQVILKEPGDMTAKPVNMDDNSASKPTQRRSLFQRIMKYFLPSLGIGLGLWALTNPATAPLAMTAGTGLLLSSTFSFAGIDDMVRNIMAVMIGGENVPAYILFSDMFKMLSHRSFLNKENMLANLPPGFVENDPDVKYRGMVFSTYESFDEMLRYGLRGDKTNEQMGKGKVYFTDIIDAAIVYSLQSWFGHVPVLVKIKKYKEEERFKEHEFAFDNIAPEDIEEILVWDYFNWRRVVVNDEGEIILQIVESTQSDISAEEHLNLKTDIVESEPVTLLVSKLKDINGNVRAYYKQTREKEIDRTLEFHQIVEKENLQNKYPLIELEYPRVLSTNLSDLPEAIAAKQKRWKDDIYSFDSDLITSVVNTDGYCLYDPPSKGLHVFKDKPITNDEWAQVVNFIKDLNKAGFYHTDLGNNLFFRRDDNKKLVVTIIDFEDQGDKDDIVTLERMRIDFEYTGVKEETPQDSPITNNGNSSFKLPSWVLPAVGVGLLTFALANPATAPFTLAAVPLLAGTNPVSTTEKISGGGGNIR